MKQGFSRRQQQEERHGRRTKGPELASALWGRSAKTDGIRFRLRFENRLLRWLPFGPSYRIPKRLEASHILMMGDTGSGKSNAIRQLLRQVREREESAIVYDPAMDFVSEFYSPARGDLILNPLDQRCPYWGLGLLSVASKIMFVLYQESHAHHLGNFAGHFTVELENGSCLAAKK
jgi:hypothetical protein